MPAKKKNKNLDFTGDKLLTRSLIQSTERERNKLAHEIHEGVNQKLAAAMANLEALSETQVIRNEDKQHIEYINGMISETTKELRGISGNLSPMTLYKFGLYAAVQQLFSYKTIKQNIKTKFISNLGSLRFKNEIEITVYRIVEEALNNTMCHAEAKKVTVTLHYENNTLSLLIKDNGQGMAPNKLGLKKLSTFGILNMEALAKSIGAVLSLKTSVGKGFAINLSVNSKTISYD